MPHFNTMDQIRTTTSPYLHLDPQLVRNRNHLGMYTAEILPSYLQSYDLRTTGHELQYGDIDLDLQYQDMPTSVRYWYRGKYSANGTYIHIDQWNHYDADLYA